MWSRYRSSMSDALRRVFIGVFRVWTIVGTINLLSSVPCRQQSGMMVFEVDTHIQHSISDSGTSNQVILEEVLDQLSVCLAAAAPCHGFEVTAECAEQVAE